MSAGKVIALSLTVVKGTRLREVDSIELGPSGARGDRRFFVIDGHDRMVNGKQLGPLQAVAAEFDFDTSVLALRFPDGSCVQGEVVEGATIEAGFYAATHPGRLVEGPFSAALSAHVGRPLRLVASIGAAVDRRENGATSLISSASLQRLADEGRVESLDRRRFRMLIEIDGLVAHAEDRWIGRSVKVGGAVVHFEGNVGRCKVPNRDPETGVKDLPTLRWLRAYRGSEPTTEAIPFGIYGRVLRPGAVAVGDTVTPI
jgi:uncharacterized protein YcbX